MHTLTGNLLAVAQLLRAVGPRTSAEIADEIGTTVSAASNAIVSLRERKIVRITEWVRDDLLGGRRLLRARYSLGTLPDAKRPSPISDKQSARDYRARKAARRRVPRSVFHLGAIMAADLSREAHA